MDVMLTRHNNVLESVHPLLEGPTQTAPPLASSLRVSNGPSQETIHNSTASMPSYTPKAQPTTLGDSPKPSPAAQPAASHMASSFVSYNAKGQAAVVTSSQLGLADGVYIGFNVAGINDKTVPHEYVEVMKNHIPTVFEYGPASTVLGGEGSPIVEMNQKYRDSDANAGALFSVSSPGGESLNSFENRTLALGHAMDALLGKEQIAYDVTAQVSLNCYSAADALLLNAGVSFNSIESSGILAGATQNNWLYSAFQSAAPAAQTTPTGALTTFGLTVQDAAAAGVQNCDWYGNADVAQMQRGSNGQWQDIPSPHPMPVTLPSHIDQNAFQVSMQNDVADATDVGNLINTTLTQLLGLTGGSIDFSKTFGSGNQQQLAITIQQIDQVIGALEDAIHGGNVANDILKIAAALEARDPQGLANVASATQLYHDFQQIGQGPQRTIDGILAMGRDVLAWGQNPTNLAGSTGSLYNDLQRAQNDVDTGFAVLADTGALLHGGNPIAAATQLGIDLHLSGAVAKDYYDVLDGIGALSEIGRGGFLNITDGTVKLGETIVSPTSEFGKWLNQHGQDIVGAAAAFEQILGGGVLNIAQGSINLGEDLVRLNVVDAKSALGSWLMQNGARFTGVIGGITSIIQGFEEGGVQGGIQSGIGADVLLTTIGLSGGIATPVAIVLGVLAIAFGGNHDNPSTMPDKYDTSRYGQMVADLKGSMGASGQNFTEDPSLFKLFGGRTGIQAVEETLAYFKTKDNAPTWLKPIWDQLVSMFGESGQGGGQLSIGINGSGKDCNNQEVLNAPGLDGKVYQYTDLGSMLYAFAAALAAGTSGQGLEVNSGYTGTYPSIAGLDWHAVRTGSGFGFYAEDQSKFGNFYSYDPANNNLYYGTTSGTVGGTWIGDVRTYDFKNHNAITGQAPPTPTYGGVAWHGFSLQNGGVAYWGSVSTTKKVTINPGDPGSVVPGKGGIKRPIGPITITEHVMTYYFFGPDGLLYNGNGSGWLAKGSIVGNVANYDFSKGGVQTPAPEPVNPLPLPIKPPVNPLPPPVKPPVNPLPLPVKPPVKPPVNPLPLPVKPVRIVSPVFSHLRNTMALKQRGAR